MTVPRDCRKPANAKQSTNGQAFRAAMSAKRRGLYCHKNFLSCNAGNRICGKCSGTVQKRSYGVTQRDLEA